MLITRPVLTGKITKKTDISILLSENKSIGTAPVPIQESDFLENFTQQLMWSIQDDRVLKEHLHFSFKDSYNNPCIELPVQVMTTLPESLETDVCFATKQTLCKLNLCSNDKVQWFFYSLKNILFI